MINFVMLGRVSFDETGLGNISLGQGAGGWQARVGNIRLVGVMLS
jgi:hypothetical protein